MNPGGRQAPGAGSSAAPRLGLSWPVQPRSETPTAPRRRGTPLPTGPARLFMPPLRLLRSRPVSCFSRRRAEGVRAGPGHSAPQCPLKPRPPGASSLEALKGLVSLARQGAAPVGPCGPGRPSRWVSGTRSHLATQRPGLPRWLPGSGARPDHFGSWCVPRAPPVSSCLGFWEKRLPETEPAGMQWALCPPCLPVLSQGPPATQPQGDGCST